jgi:sodium-coupled neutral amino acid transporter 11
MKVRFDLPGGDDGDAAGADGYTSVRDVGHEPPRDYSRDSFDDGDARQEEESHSAPLLPSASTPIDSSLSLDNPLDRPTSSLHAAISNMSNSILGAGIIGQPYALKEAGLATGLTLLVILTVVVDWTIRLIVINSKMSGRHTFQGTVEFCFGRWGLLVISFAQWAFAFGGMVAFAVIVGDSIPPVLQAVWPGLKDVRVLGWLAGRNGAIVVFCGGVSWPLSLYRDISKVCGPGGFVLFGELWM